MSEYELIVAAMAENIANSDNFLERVRTVRSEAVEREAWRLWDNKLKKEVKQS